MLLNYSAIETMAIDPEFSTLAELSTAYSFDRGATWTNTELGPEGFRVACQRRSQLWLRMNATDMTGNTYYYALTPAALCKRMSTPKSRQSMLRQYLLGSLTSTGKL